MTNHFIGEVHLIQYLKNVLRKVIWWLAEIQFY